MNSVQSKIIIKYESSNLFVFACICCLRQHCYDRDDEEIGKKRKERVVVIFVNVEVDVFVGLSTSTGVCHP